MRRLAKQNRNDEYSSNRDYQALHERRGQRIEPRDEGTFLMVMRGTAAEGETDLIGAGGFLFASKDVTVRATLGAGEREVSKRLALGPVWKRFGVVVLSPDAEALELRLQYPADVSLDIWGINGARLTLPEGVEVDADELGRTHLAPETFYLEHDVVMALDLDEEASSKFTLTDGAAISLKKCAYCQRLLPLNMDLLGSLSFHKHNAKKTNHQNECRSCKKWRINNTFNPLRTTDQLHESSVITRERKLFLREPEILQEIKDRTGAGLKSQVWRRFDKKCFFCGRELALNEVQLDHTRPLAYLWPIDEYATCLCADHNNLKKDKFPVNFYNEEQLRRLSQITGLDMAELCIRDVNEVELKRILEHLPRFAKEWDPRTFAATARKIIEVRPDVDLFDRLARIDPEAFDDLNALLAERPPSVGADDE